jgi:hypothetical protein
MNESSRQEKLNDVELQLWREAMTQLRHLSDDVFKSVALFMGLNVLLLTMAVVLTLVDLSPCRWLGAFVCVLGSALTLAARFLLKRHRIYYLEMLAKKSLLEMQLGLYERRLAGTDVDSALPWRLKPEVVSEIAKDFDGWVQKSIRSSGTMARIYFWMYEGLIAIYGAGLICAAIQY